MELPFPNFQDCEIRAVIRFFCAKGKIGSDIHRELVSVYGEKCMSVRMVQKWVDQFKKGRAEIHDLQRSGRPCEAISEDAVNAVQIVVNNDRRVNVRDIRRALMEDYSIEISVGSISTIIHENLAMRKVCARWVPRELTDGHKAKRVEAGNQLFLLLKTIGPEVYQWIVTGDESWVHHYTPETKKQSMSWIGPGEKAPTKFKTHNSAGKVMLTVFWDSEGVLLEDYLEKGRTINAQYYCEILEKLRRAIQNKRRGKLRRGIVFLHDNARPHAAAITQDRLDSFTWDVFPHPPYSPDLAPSDYHLFPYLKAELGGIHFQSVEAVKQACQTFFKNQPKEFYERGILKLATRYQTCLDRGGDYVEK